MSTFVTNAIVLNYESKGESDRVYHLFTDKFGKIDALAKGSQKILSKIGPHLEPPVISRVLIAKGKNFDRLAGAAILKGFPAAREDFDKREILFFCFKMVSLSTRPEGADEGVYKFLEEFVDGLEKMPSVAIKESRVSIIISFLLRFFSLIGFHPDFCLPPHLSAEYQTFQKGLDDVGERWGGKNNPSKEKMETWVSGILEKQVRIC